jgi:tight adherence protein B
LEGETLSAIAVVILAFLGVFLAVFAANAILVDLHSSERGRLKKRLEEQLRARQKEQVRTSHLQHDFSQVASDASADGEKWRGFRNSLGLQIEQSGVNVSVDRLLIMSVVCAVVLGAVGVLLSGGVLIALVATAAGAVAPWMYVRHKRRSRLAKMRTQLPHAFELMSRVLRAGHTIPQAMQCVAEEFSPPIALEFLYCYEQMNLGLSLEAALKALSKRTGLLEIRIFVLAVVVHRQTGGNLAELLDKLGTVVRERFRIQGMITSLTAQGRFQAGILLSLPPAMFLLLMVLHHEYGMTLLQFPMMIVTALGLMAAGAFWIHKIVDFDY